MFYGFKGAYNYIMQLNTNIKPRIVRINSFEHSTQPQTAPTYVTHNSFIRPPIPQPPQARPASHAQYTNPNQTYSYKVKTALDKKPHEQSLDSMARKIP